MSVASRDTGSFPPSMVAEFRVIYLGGPNEPGGWRAVERTYGCSSPVLMKLFAAAGGQALLAERRAIQRTGRKAGRSQLEKAG